MSDSEAVGKGREPVAELCCSPFETSFLFRNMVVVVLGVVFIFSWGGEGENTGHGATEESADDKPFKQQILRSINCAEHPRCTIFLYLWFL